MNNPAIGWVSRYVGRETRTPVHLLTHCLLVVGSGAVPRLPKTGSDAAARSAPLAAVGCTRRIPRAPALAGSEQVSDVNLLLPAARCELVGNSDDLYPRSVIQREDVPDFYGVVALEGLEDLTVSLGRHPSWVTSDAAVVNSYLDHAATLHRRWPARMNLAGLGGDDPRLLCLGEVRPRSPHASIASLQRARGS